MFQFLMRRVTDCPIRCAAALDLNAWRAVRMDRPLPLMIQQWRAARVRTRTDRPEVSYPPLVTALSQTARYHHDSC